MKQQKRHIHEPYVAMGQFGAYRREDGRLMVELVPSGKGGVALYKMVRDEGCALQITFDDEEGG